MEMWCLYDTGRDGWDWVGPPAWGEGWRLLAGYHGASPDCIIVVVMDDDSRLCLSTPGTPESMH